jgi:hypothetical protein
VLGERQPDGATLREHYENAQRQTGQVPGALADVPACPEELHYLWEYFVNISARRTSNDDAVSNAEVLAWALLHHVQLTAFEVEVLDGLERVFLVHYAARAAERAARK